MTIMRTAPWRRGPVLLMRRLGVAFALVVAAAVATVPAAAAGPFLSSSRDATLEHQIAPKCQFTHGMSVTGTLVYQEPRFYYGPDGFSYPDATTGADIRKIRIDYLGSLAAQVPGIGAPVQTDWMSVNGPTVDPAVKTDVTVMYRDDATDHVTVTSGPHGKGVWIPDTYAAIAHLKVGDPFRALASTPDAEAPIPVNTRVAAIYHDLNTVFPAPAWWCSTATTWRIPPNYSGNRPWPPLVLATDVGDFDRIGVTSGVNSTQMTEYPLSPAMPDQDHARRTAAAMTAMIPAVFDPAKRLYAQDFFLRSSAGSSLPDFTKRADLARTGMKPAVVPITAVGVFVGLVVVGAATAFWVRRRRQELVILASRGAGPLSLGVKALLEAGPALVVGTAVGWLSAWWLVRVVGPSPALTREAAPLAAYGAAGSLVATLLVVFAVATLTTRGLVDVLPPAHRSRLRRLPWELVLLAAVPMVWRRLGGATRVADTAGGVGVVEHVPGRLLIVPIVVVAGLAVLAGRVVVATARRTTPAARRTADANGARTPPTGARRVGAGRFLGTRRLRRTVLPAVALAAATAIPISLAAFGAIATGSVEASTDAQATLIRGADTVFTLSQPAPIPASLRGRATEVTRLDGVIFDDTYETSVLEIDPETFPGVAFFDGVDGPSVADMIAPLRRPVAAGAPVPVVATRPVRPGPQDTRWGATLPAIGDGSVTVYGVARLPAARAGNPVALVARGHLTQGGHGVVQLWVKGDPDTAIAAATAAHLPVTRTDVARDSFANTLFEPLTFTFGYLTALSLLAGAVTLVGLLLYLESQAQARRRGFVMLRRMGLAAGSHRVALIVEVCTPLVAGLLGGLAAAAGIVAAVRASFDLEPLTPPGTVLAVPYASLSRITVAALVAAVVTALYTHWRISRAPSGEVLRDTV
jgi:putative ABC transport system permease protein